MSLEVIRSSEVSGYQSLENQNTETTVLNSQTSSSGENTIQVTGVSAQSESEQGSSESNMNQTAEVQQELNGKKVKEAVNEVNKKINRHTSCEFSYHEDTKRVSIRVIDKDTKEVIREIPPEKSLDMLEKMWEMAGILIDERR